MARVLRQVSVAARESTTVAMGGVYAAVGGRCGGGSKADTLSGGC